MNLVNASHRNLHSNQMKLVFLFLGLLYLTTYMAHKLHIWLLTHTHKLHIWQLTSIKNKDICVIFILRPCDFSLNFFLQAFQSLYWYLFSTHYLFIPFMSVHVFMCVNIQDNFVACKVYLNDVFLFHLLFCFYFTLIRCPDKAFLLKLFTYSLYGNNSFLSSILWCFEAFF